MLSRVVNPTFKCIIYVTYVELFLTLLLGIGTRIISGKKGLIADEIWQPCSCTFVPPARYPLFEKKRLGGSPL
jgi:hypothetical protein